MSIVRWGVDGSAVYVYDDVDGGATCWGCSDGKNLSDDRMLAHLKEHLERGDTVPEWVLESFNAK